jgi:hypothetical protein
MQQIKFQILPHSPQRATITNLELDKIHLNVYSREPTQDEARQFLERCDWNVPLAVKTYLADQLEKRNSKMLNVRVECIELF